KVSNMTVDNWGLKKLFHFDDKHWNINNDTTEIITVKTRTGQEVQIKPGETTHINPDRYSIVLPNNKTIRYSDKKSLTEEDFWENFNVIIEHLVKRLKEGHVIDGLDFLDYHYAWTKDKSRFLTFIKHYIISVSWMQTNKKDNFEMFTNAVSDWVEEKKKLKRRPFHIAVLVFPLIVYVACWILSPDYKEL